MASKGGSTFNAGVRRPAPECLPSSANLVGIAPKLFGAMFTRRGLG